MKHMDLRKLWVSRIAAFKQSEESIPEWCANHDLKNYFWGTCA